MARTQFITFLPVSEVFPDIDSNLDTLKLLLERLSRTDTLFWCGRLNLVISDPDVDHVKRQEFGLNQFLSPEEVERVNRFVRKSGGANKTGVFFRGQLLELIRWATLYCSDHADDGVTFERPEVRRTFAQAALIASDVWAQRVYRDRLSSAGDIEVARRKSLGAIRKAVEGSLSTPYLFRSLGRGWDLFGTYLPRQSPSFDSLFERSTGLSISEYFICLGALITSFVNPKEGAGLFDANTVGGSTPYADTVQRYLRLESQTTDELKTALWGPAVRKGQESGVADYDYQPLRRRPILRSLDGRAIVLDPVFFSEKATVGPLFLVPRTERQQMFSDFGKAFEDYACDMLGRMFPDVTQAKTRRFSRSIVATDCDGTELEIDACVNDVFEAVLFEMKTGLIPEQTILSKDHETYLQELRKKYVWSEKEKPVGAGQLAKSIKILAARKWVGEDQEYGKVRLVYPILLIHDTLLGAPLHGNYLASEFKRLLAPDEELPSGELVKGELRVAPLILMTIEELEDLETSIEHFGFRDLLSTYSRRHPDREVSLHDFIGSSAFKDRIYANKSLGAAALNILEKVKREVFPNS